MQLSHALRQSIRSLHSKEDRDTQQLFIAEGEKLCKELLQSSFQTEFLVVRTPISPTIEIIAREFVERGIDVYETNDHSFRQISDAHSPQGILAVVRYPTIQKIMDDKVIILDGIADPGNAGTIIRTAEWFGFTTIIFIGNSAHRFHPKTVRATMGSLWRIHLFQPTNSELFIKEQLHEYNLYGASLRASLSLSDCTPTGKYGIVFGSESHGISSDIVSILSHEYSIPSVGNAESLNVSVAAGISLYHFAVNCLNRDF
jgi:TrmH family RNA methyltransferase